MADHPHSFVRRLIPSVAVATFTFAGCGEPDSNNANNANNNPFQNNTNGNNMANNQTPNNQTPNNQTPNNQTPNNQTPNNTTPNNQTPNNQTPNNSSIGVIVNSDGTVSADEFRSLCEAFSACDSTYFMESYASIDECATTLAMNHAEYLAQYTMDYSAECAAVMDAQTECFLTAVRCAAGEITSDDAVYEQCYMQFYDQYEMLCTSE